MSNFEPLKRQVSILREIQRVEYPSVGELQKKFDIKSATFKRDIEAIKQFFTPNLSYNPKEKGYKIEGEIEGEALLILETFELLAFIHSTDGVNEFIIPEKRKATGTEHFFILKKCIEDQKAVTFSHHNYVNNESGELKECLLQPLALKESRGRWYVLGTKEDGTFRSYGLDRITLLEETGNKFERKLNKLELIKKYEDCFAMYTSESPAEKVVLSYSIEEINYIKSYPILSEQEIKEKNGRMEVTLHIKITEDLFTELLSHARSVEIIEPLHLRERFYNYFKEAMERNQ
jgi:proteasome accessory factor B